MLNKISNVIVKIFFGLFIILYSKANIFFSVYTKNYESYHAYYSSGYTVLSVVLFIVLVLGLYILIKNDFFKIDDKHLLILFMIVCLIVGLIWMFVCPSNIVVYDDAYNVYEAAKAVNKGDYLPLARGSYLSIHPNNLGLFTWDLINIKIFGESYALYSIRIINLLSVIITYYSLYKLCDLLFSNKLVNCILIYLMFGSMQLVFVSYYVYGYCICYGFSLLSTYLLASYIKKDHNKYLILAVISLMPAIFIKTNSLIVLIAELIYLVLHMINKRKFKLIIAIVIMIAYSFILTYGIQGYYGSLTKANYNETTMPTSAFVAYGLNLNSNTPGYFTPEYETFHISHNLNKEWTDEEAKRYISNTLETFKDNPTIALEFYKNKLLASWANPEYEVFNQFAGYKLDKLSYSIVNGKLNSFLDNLWDSVQSIISIGLLAYLFKRFKKANLIELIGAVVIIGGFLFHLFWETKAIYTYQYYMYLLPYAAHGLFVLLRNKDGN